MCLSRLRRPIYRSCHVKRSKRKLTLKYLIPEDNATQLPFQPLHKYKVSMLTVSSSSMSILNVCCCKVFKVICILTSFYSRAWFKRCKSNLQESWLFLLAHHKLSAAMTFTYFFFYGRYLGKSAPAGCP